MVKIIFLKGLPASGKTTWAVNYCKNNPNFVRLNKDDLRLKFAYLNKDDKWNEDFENKILNLQREKGTFLLKSGKSIIIDDTNFSKKHEEFWVKKSEELGVLFEIKDFNVPVDVCISRDKLREKSIGEDVIKNMYNKYIKHNKIKTDSRLITRQDRNLEKCIIVDLDGTLALINGRNPYDDSLLYKDKVNYPLLEFISNFISTHHIIIVSARMDSCRSETEEWLTFNNIPYSRLLMREAGDFRKDRIVKKEIYENHIKDLYYVSAWFDDRDQVVEMVRDELGLLCLQVYYGNF